MGKGLDLRVKLLSTPLPGDETQQDRNSCLRLHLGFQFGRYHVFVEINFLRSFSLA